MTKCGSGTNQIAKIPMIANIPTYTKFLPAHFPLLTHLPILSLLPPQLPTLPTLLLHVPPSLLLGSSDRCGGSSNGRNGGRCCGMVVGVVVVVVVVGVVVILVIKHPVFNS